MKYRYYARPGIYRCSVCDKPIENKKEACTTYNDDRGPTSTNNLMCSLTCQNVFKINPLVYEGRHQIVLYKGRPLKRDERW